MIATRTLSSRRRAWPFEEPLVLVIADEVPYVGRLMLACARKGARRRRKRYPPTTVLLHPDRSIHVPAGAFSSRRTKAIRWIVVISDSPARTYTAGASRPKCPSDAPLANTSPIDRMTTRTGRVASPTLHATPRASARARV